MIRYIFSGAYISNELCAEFGKIPPSFLPVGGLRLFENQLSPDSNVLVLPSCFCLPIIDAQRLDFLAVEVRQIDTNLSLIDALRTVLGGVDEPFEILLGDTLIQKPCDLRQANLVSMSEVYDDNSWDYINISNNKNYIFTGYIQCISPDKFIKYLTDSDSISTLLGLLKNAADFDFFESKDWLDFGHITTFFKSKRHFSTARSFNELQYLEDRVVKKSTNELKIQAEIDWYNSLPVTNHNLTPAFLGSSKATGVLSYELEYCPFSTLADLYVFGSLTDQHWHSIIDKILDTFSILANISSESLGSLDGLFNKTKERIGMLNGSQFPIDYLTKLVDNIQPIVTNETWVFAHGDLCLSNILWDFRLERPKLIDPRGLDLTNNISTKLPFIYDLAKLAQSINGLYDHIVFKRYQLLDDTIVFDSDVLDFSKKMSSYLFDSIFERYRISRRELTAMQVLLFIGLIPLHSDDEYRQKAFLLNIHRICKDL